MHRSTHYQGVESATGRGDVERRCTAELLYKDNAMTAPLPDNVIALRPRPQRPGARPSPPREIGLRYSWRILLTDAGRRGGDGVALVFGQLFDASGELVASVLPSRAAAAESALRTEHAGRTGLFGRRWRR